MTLIRKNIAWVVGFVAIVLFTAPSTAFAELEVVFETTPLFSEANILPGGTVTRTVIVTNTGTTTESVYVSVANSSSGGLADIMNLSVTSFPTSYYDGTFTSFFTSTPLGLGTLSTNSSRTYEFTASLPESAENSYQAATMQFDLVIGFWGGDSIVDNDGGGNNNNGGGGNNNNDSNGAVPQVSGATTDGFSALLNSILERLRELSGSNPSSILSVFASDDDERVEDSATTTPEGEVLGDEAVPLTETDTEEDDGWCKYWWLLVVIWLVGSIVVYWFKGGEKEGALTIGNTQVAFGTLSLVLLALAYLALFPLITVHCVFWPALITIIGSVAVWVLTR